MQYQGITLSLKFAFCTRAHTSNEVKISIEAARLACPESKDETHFLPLPLCVPIAEFDPADQSVGCGMSIGTEMLCDGKTRRILVMLQESSPKRSLRVRPVSPNVNDRAAAAGKAVNQTGGQASEGIFDG